VKYAIADSICALIVSFLSYLELCLKLLGLEAREAGLHLLIIGLLLFTTLTCLAGSVLLLVVFILCLMTLILRLAWGLVRLDLSWDTFCD
jgi:p-aminobenzoyl-glutamate transporter AbgT